MFIKIVTTEIVEIEDESKVNDYFKLDDYDIQTAIEQNHDVEYVSTEFYKVDETYKHDEIILKV